MTWVYEGEGGPLTQRVWRLVCDGCGKQTTPISRVPESFFPVLEDVELEKSGLHPGAARDAHACSVPCEAAVRLGSVRTRPRQRR